MIDSEKFALSILVEKGEAGATISELANRLDMSKSGTLDLMKRLMESRYVKGEQHTDQNVWRLWITLSGEVALAERNVKDNLQMDMGFEDDEDFGLEIL